MSEDFTQKLPKSGNDEILTAIKDLDTKVTTIDVRLQSLEQKVDARLHDTRPIWHKVIADIAELQAGQKRLEEGQQAIHSGMINISSRVNNVELDQRVINDAVRRMQMDFLTVTEWLNKLTADRNQQNSTT